MNPGANTGSPDLIGDVVFGDRSNPVAVCTLASRGLLAQFTGRPEIAIAGRVFTENVGIERMIQNLAADPALRILIVCGRESSHRVGQTIFCLHRSGLDADRRVVGSLAPEPFLPNLSVAELRHFREEIQLIDMIGVVDVDLVLARAREAAEALAGPPADSRRGTSDRLDPERADQPVERVVATPNDRSEWRYDPSGFFLIFPDRARKIIRLEHYGQDRVLRRVLEGASSEALCHTLVRLGLVTELAHAAYLGRELAKAEAALRLGLHYEQDSPLDPRRTPPPSPLPMGEG